MTSDLALAAAAGIGLLGSVHCVAMCGGIASAVALTAGAEARRGARLRLLATVSAGRVLGYAAAGALAGALGFGLAELLGPWGAAALRVLAGAVLVSIALALAGWWHAPLALETLGARAWRRLAPLAGRLRQDVRGGRALLLGVLWGWIPCGLVYSALGWAATTGGPVGGALVMVAFGCGTLPALLLTGSAALRLGRVVRAASSRRLAAAALALFGLWTIAGGVALARSAARGVPCHGGEVVAQTRR